MKSLKEYMERQQIRDFMEGVQRQITGRNFTEETVNTAVNTMFRIFNRADGMTDEEVASYITTCLAVYILSSYETEEDIITDIWPGKNKGGTMEEKPLKTKTECGLVYYDVNGEWKLAGREGHPLTERYIKLLQGKPSCVCGCTKCE